MYEVIITWTARDPSFERDIRRVEIDAKDQVDAAYTAFEKEMGRKLQFSECECDRKQFREQLQDRDPCIIGSHLAEVPVGYRGQYTFMVTPI